MVKPVKKESSETYKSTKRPTTRKKKRKDGKNGVRRRTGKDQRKGHEDQPQPHFRSPPHFSPPQLLRQRRLQQLQLLPEGQQQPEGLHPHRPQEDHLPLLQRRPRPCQIIMITTMKQRMMTPRLIQNCLVTITATYITKSIMKN